MILYWILGFGFWDKDNIDVLHFFDNSLLLFRFCFFFFKFKRSEKEFFKNAQVSIYSLADPCGICTDILGHILVCNPVNGTAL